MAKSKTVTKTKHGTIDGNQWIWPDGTKTHMRFIQQAVIKSQPLPIGFYEEAEKLNNRFLNHLVAVAKERKLKCTVDNKKHHD